MLVEVLIPILQCFLRSFVEYSDFVAINDRDIAAFEMVWLVDFRIEAPVVVLKVSKALTSTEAFDLFLLIYFGVVGAAVAALFTIWVLARLMVW